MSAEAKARILRQVLPLPVLSLLAPTVVTATTACHLMSVAAVATDENRIVAAAAADENWRLDNQVVIWSTGHQGWMTTNHRTGTPVGKVSMNTEEGAGVGIGHHPRLDPLPSMTNTGAEKDRGLHPH